MAPKSSFGREGCWMFLSLWLSRLYSKRFPDADTPVSYDPVSNFLFLGKVFKQVVTQRVQAHLDAVRFMTPVSLAFILGTLLLALVEDFWLEINGGNCTLLILLDFFSVVFDAVDQGKLFVTCWIFTGPFLTDSTLSWPVGRWMNSYYLLGIFPVEFPSLHLVVPCFSMCIWDHWERFVWQFIVRCHQVSIRIKSGWFSAWLKLGTGCWWTNRSWIQTRWRTWWLAYFRTWRG